jgi:4-amino-4-deoxy-L-arabinose transferase-like glycosyltransferase
MDEISNLSTKRPEKGPGWGVALLIALLAAAALLAVASASTLWDRDEPRFARATVEMLASGNYLVPTFNGHLRPDKPILIYWLMALPVSLFGAGEAAVRFWAPVGIAATVLLTYAAGRWLGSPRAGLLAGGLLALTPLTLMEGSAATTDAVLLAFITLAIATFAHAFLQGWKAIHGGILALAFGGALLTKGPVGLAVPLASILVTWVLGRRDTPLRGRHLAWVGAAAAAGIGLFLLWAVPANQATGGEFARRGLGHHVVDRMSQPLEGHGGSWLLFLPYYLVVILIAFFPWTAFLGGAASALLGGRLGGRRGRALLLGWIVPAFVLMTLVATKLPHYILPIWPGLALAVAATLEAHASGRLAERDRIWLRRGQWLLGVPGFAIGAALLAVPRLLSAPELRLPCFAAGLATLGTTLLALRHHRAGRMQASCAVLGLGTLLLGLVLLLGILPAAERLKVSPAIAAAIRSRTPAGVPVASYRYAEPSLLFYLGRGPVRELADAGEAARWLREPGPGVLVLPSEELARLAREAGRLPAVPLANRRGYNYSKGKWVDLVAVRRGRFSSLPDLVHNPRHEDERAASVH